MVTDYTWYSYIALQIRLRGEGKYSKQEWKPMLNEVKKRMPVHKPGSVIEYLKQSGAIGVIDE